MWKLNTSVLNFHFKLFQRNQCVHFRFYVPIYLFIILCDSNIYVFFPPTVQTPPGFPHLPSVLPTLLAGPHTEAGAVLRGPGGAGRHKPRLWLRPLHPQTHPATRRGPQGQWPHRGLSGENACPSGSPCWLEGGQELWCESDVLCRKLSYEDLILDY